MSEFDVQMQYEECEEGMMKVVDHLETYLQSIRAGRANPHVLDKIMVDYYGAMTPLNQMANISVSEARILTISVWDASALKNVIKAIMASDLGITPTDDGKVIRLVFPQLTEERRRDLVKDIKKVGEESKVALRNVRRDCLEKFKKAKKDSTISEDVAADAEKEVQKITDKYINDVETLLSKKEKEVLDI